MKKVLNLLGDFVCPHRRRKRNFPFGRNSKPFTYCKNCGEVIKPMKLKQQNRNRRKRR